MRIGIHIARRLGQFALLLVLVTAATCLLSAMIPGDFFAVQELDPAIGRETIAQLRMKHGLDQPVWIQYVRWLSNLMRLDLGYSLHYQLPVRTVLLSAAGGTLWLALPALLAGILGGVLIGTLHATWKGRPEGLALDLLSTVLLSLPSLVLGLTALLLAARTQWFPLGGMSSMTPASPGWAGWLLDRLHHLVLPVTCLSIPVLSAIERLQHTSARQTLDEPHVRSARARGLPESRIFLQHVLRPSLNAVISTSGPLLGAVLSGSLVLEIIFSWPGLGRMTYDALFNRDLFLLLGAVLASSILLMAGNLAADLLLTRLDPRTHRPARESEVR